MKTRQNGDGAIPLHYAAQHAQTDCARILLAGTKAGSIAGPKAGIKAGTKAGTKAGSVNDKTFSWSTPLHEVSI